MKPVSRRKFLKNAAAIPVGFTLGKMPLQETGTPVSSEKYGAKIKLSLNAWSYNVPLYKYIRGEKGGMSLFDLLEECARLDLDAIDPTGYFFPGFPEPPDKKYLNEFKRRAFQLGLDISGTGIRNNFATADTRKRKDDIALTKQWIEVAAEMGAPVLRVFAGEQPKDKTWQETAVWMSDALAECAEYGASYGVLVGVQNHGGMLKTAEEVLKIIHMVRSDWFGAIVDTGYFLTSDPYADIEKVIPHAVNWQVKELLNNRKGGPIDLVRLVNIIRKSNYRGYIPVETLPIPGKEKEYDPFTQVPELLSNLRKALGRDV